jgi:hypothetical protein
MIFMGTPHRGTGSALHTQGQIYKAIVSANYNVEDNALRNLDGGNETLVDIVREFTRLITLPPPVQIFCFVEQRPTVVGKIVNDDKIQVCRTILVFAV